MSAGSTPDTVTTAPRHRTGAKVGVSLLVTPPAIAVGIVTYFIIGMWFWGPFMDGLNSRGQVLDPGTGYSGLLWLSIIGSVAGAWATVWRLMR